MLALRSSRHLVFLIPKLFNSGYVQNPIIHIVLNLYKQLASYNNTWLSIKLSRPLVTPKHCVRLIGIDSRIRVRCIGTALGVGALNLVLSEPTGVLVAANLRSEAGILAIGIEKASLMDLGAVRLGVAQILGGVGHV